MDGLRKKILLFENIQFEGSTEELINRLKSREANKFQIKWIAPNEFKFFAQISDGTLIVDYNPNLIEGIKGYAKFKEEEDGKVEIEFWTKLRIEFYFLLVLWLLFLLGSFLSEKEIPIFLYSIFPIIFMWFWFVFRIQEKRLFKKMKEFLERK